MDGDVAFGEIRLTPRWYAMYLYAEAAAVAAWWIALYVSAETVRAFRWPGIPDEVLFAFLAPDAVLVMGAGVAAAWGTARGYRWAWATAHFHLGGVMYPGLLTVALSCKTGGGWIGAVVMTAQSVIGLIAMFMVRNSVGSPDAISE